jgi:uncharacterized membrane protein (UPF0127 family)
MGREALGPGAGMLIGAGPLIPVIWIHTFFMRFALDLVFLDSANQITRIISNVKPWRVAPPVFGARFVLELEAGAAALSRSNPGDMVRLESV